MDYGNVRGVSAALRGFQRGFKEVSGVKGVKSDLGEVSGIF